MKNNFQRIILIRHGQTTLDKENPLRGLTEGGIKKTKMLAKKIEKFDVTTNMILISADNYRSIQTARIISQTIKVRYYQNYSRLFDTTTVKNWELIKSIKTRNSKYLDVDLTKLYLKLSERGFLPKDIKKPITVAEKFVKLIKKIRIQKRTLLFVGNGGTLEAIAYYQSLFKTKESDIIRTRILNYSDYLVLEKIEN